MTAPMVEGKNCPHCGEAMKKWAAPGFNHSDGLGFGVPYMYVCFNDDCSLFVNGWNTMYDNYGRIGSMRQFFNSFDGDEGALPVAHRDAMRGDIMEA
ncbi:MAG: hypothetical protein HQL57_05860 [Magnetococcales bacterium]|nr:hypothetical protein [Magnetococcales bacterium]MBF0156692.1 hypothetical protein [Magnetococcales bacterium]